MEILTNMKTLVEFCIKSYFKMYFNIKVWHHLVHGPGHVLTQLRIFRSLLKHLQQIIEPYIRTGAWYSHSESILLSLLGSMEPGDRKFAVDIILKLRGKSDIGDLSVRDRRMPRLNLQAKSLQTMIEWKIEEVHEPVYTCCLSRQDLQRDYCRTI